MRSKTVRIAAAAALILALLLSFGSAGGAQAKKKDIKGDADANGAVTAADARLVMRAAVTLDKTTAELMSVADMDEDGDMTPVDALLVLRLSLDMDLTEESFAEGEKILYMTFDDGPSERTTEILDILDRYNAKATFFVINAGSYNYLYKEIVDRGHSIGLHSYTHDFNIYSSTDAFFNDLQMISDAVYEVTGIRTKLMRFAGGSSNTLSGKYCEGIMTVLTQMVEERGYVYFDWNYANNDATGQTLTAYQMQQAAARGLGEDRVVMLMHDASWKHTTVEALPGIIEMYQEAGYRCLALNENSYTAHHPVLN